MFNKMQQQQVNITNYTHSALDCAESRTVRTINTKQAQQQRQRTACNQSNELYSNSVSVTSTAVPHLSEATHLDNGYLAIGNPNNSNVTCSMTSTKAGEASVSKMQNARLSVKARSPKRAPLMKSAALLPIICFAVLAHVSTASARTLPGRRHILHTLENRMQHHKNLMLQESERMPSHTVPAYRHHHLNIRSLDMNCMDIAKVVRSLKIQAEVSLQTLKDNVHNYTLPRFNTTPENATEYWIKSKLNLSHPYQKFLDRDFTKSVVSHDFSHLEGKTLDEELLKVELNKIYKTIKTLQIIFTRLSEENQKNEQALMHRYRQGFNDMNKYLDVTRVELNNNLQITKSAIDTLKITMENFDENSVTYNETVFAKDWLMVVENISFLQYLDQLYALLLKMCNGTQ